LYHAKKNNGILYHIKSGQIFKNLKQQVKQAVLIDRTVSD